MSRYQIPSINPKKRCRRNSSCVRPMIVLVPKFFCSKFFGRKRSNHVQLQNSTIRSSLANILQQFLYSENLDSTLLHLPKIFGIWSSGVCASWKYYKIVKKWPENAFREVKKSKIFLPRRRGHPFPWTPPPFGPRFFPPRPPLENALTTPLHERCPYDI